MKPHLAIPARPSRRRGIQWITLFGLGEIRPAPGTFGSMPPVILAGLMLAVVPIEWRSVALNTLMLALVVIFSLACVWQGEAAEARYGRKDPSSVIADETAGQALALLFLPAGALATPTLAAVTLVFSFLCFRAFDILKPWPAFRLQRIPGGWGILIDDLVAGLYAALMVQVVGRLMVG